VIGENVVPEFLQENCTAQNLVPALAGFSPMEQRERGSWRLSNGWTTSCQSAIARQANLRLTS